MRNNILVILLSVCSTLGLFAQTGDNSPYSRFGIGDLSDDHFHHLKQMSGLGSAYTDGFHINAVNPASYSFLRTTSFDMGIYAKKNTLKSENQEASQWTGNLEYIALGFPLYNPLNQLLDREEKKLSLGMAFMLKPHSTVSYDLASTSNVDSIGRVVRSYSGEGGSYKFLWGNSIKYQDFSFGVNLGYLFGKISYNRNLDFLDLANVRVDRFSTEYSMKGFLYDLGAIYSTVLNKKDVEENTGTAIKRINVGMRFHSTTGFSTTSDITDLGVYFINATGSSTTIDTASTTAVGLEGNGRLPGSFGVGVNYFHGEKYAIGLDYSTSNWSEYFNEANQEVKGDLANTTALAIGGYWRPDYKSFTNYWNRVYYRFGVYYRSDPRVISGNQLTSQGVTFGMGLPFVFQRKVSHANLGVDIGRSGMDTPIQENYVRFTFGFTFNDDEWFVKRKYN